MKKRITAVFTAVLMLSSMVQLNVGTVLADEAAPPAATEEAVGESSADGMIVEEPVSGIDEEEDAGAAASAEKAVEAEDAIIADTAIEEEEDPASVIVEEASVEQETEAASEEKAEDTEQTLLAETEIPAAGTMYTREATLMEGLTGVYETKAYPGEKMDTATMGIPTVSKNTLTLEHGPTTESPAIIMGAAVGYEKKTGPVEYQELKPRIAPYSYFRYGIIEEQNQGEQGTSGTHKKLSGFDGSYYIVRVDVSEIIKKYLGEDGKLGEGKYLHVKQADNKALMVAMGFDRTTYSDALGNKTGSYSLANNAIALKDTDGNYKETPYFDVILMSSGKNVAGADAGQETAPDPNVKLSFYVDDTEDYAPELTALDPNNMPTFPYKVNVNGQEVTFQTEQDYTKALLAKYYDDTKATEENNASSYKVMGGDLEIDVTVDESEADDSTKAEFWSLTNAIDYMPYDDHVIKLICEVPVLNAMSVKGNVDESRFRSIILDVNSFDIQIANNTEAKKAGLSVGEYAQFMIKDGSNTAGAELAIGNNATMDISGVMIIDETCTLEVEYDAATITGTDQTNTNPAENGMITIRNGGQVANYGVINIEGSEGKPLQPSQQEQQSGETTVKTDMKASSIAVEKDGLLVNFGCVSLKGNLYVNGQLLNYGKYNDILTTYDPDKGKKEYHKGIQITWKDDVTKEGVEPGKLFIGDKGDGTYEPEANLGNYGDIVLVPGTLDIYGELINQPEGNIYVCTVKEAVIPITPDPANPIVVEKRITLDPPKKSVFTLHSDKNAYMENYGLIGDAKVNVISNGVLGELTVLPLSQAQVELSASDFTYNGSKQVPTVKSVKIGETALSADTDYEVTYAYPESADPGCYLVTVTGKGTYEGEKSLSYMIDPVNIDEATAELSTNIYIYDGKVHVPNVTSVKMGETVLKEGTDYEVENLDPESADAGEYKIAITGKGNYEGTLYATYTIDGADITKAVIALSAAEFTYNGKVQVPTVKSVKIGETVLVEGTDYNVTYPDKTSTDAGSYMVSIEGKGNYKGVLYRPYKINSASIAGAKLVLSKTAYTYTGKVQKPTVKTVGGKTLVSGTDYTISYSNSSSKKAASYTVTVKGKGNYTGTSAKATYKIKPASIAKAKLVLTKTAYTYNGKVQKPNVKTVGGKKLTAGTDYTIVYSNKSSKKVDSYTVTVKGKGNYTGTSAKATYKINKASNPITVKAKNVFVSASTLKNTSVKITRTKVMTISKARGTVTYKKSSGHKKISIDKKTGKITIAKGLGKGIYEVKFLVRAAGNSSYKAKTKTVTVKIVVK